MLVLDRLIRNSYLDSTKFSFVYESYLINLETNSNRNNSYQWGDFSLHPTDTDLSFNTNIRETTTFFILNFGKKKKSKFTREGFHNITSVHGYVSLETKTPENSL